MGADDFDFMVTSLGLVTMVLSLSSFALSSTGLVNSLNTLQVVLLAVYGFVTAVGGILKGESLYLRYFVDVSAVMGPFLLVAAFFSVLPYGLWVRVGIVALIFMAMPSAALAYYTRESQYEELREDESDFMGRD